MLVLMGSTLHPVQKYVASHVSQFSFNFRQVSSLSPTFKRSHGPYEDDVFTMLLRFSLYFSFDLYLLITFLGQQCSDLEAQGG